MILALAIILWLACPMLCYGIVFAYFEREYADLAPELYWANLRHALMTSLWALIPPCGPMVVALVWAHCHRGKHGLKFW